MAAHLKIGPSTMSAALKRLAAMGLIVMTPEANDARAKTVRLTAAGLAALSQTSVLEFSRVRAALARLSSDERVAIVRGLELLADAVQTAK